MRSKSVVIFLTLLIALCIPVFSQTTAGSMAGTVLDPSGGAIANAKVTAIEPTKGYSLNATTDASGRFVFPNAQPGGYNIAVEAPGFKRYEQKGVILQNNQNRTVGNLKMEVGSVNEQVNVTAQGQTLQTETGERSTSLTSKQVNNIAINGRSYLPLMALVPGVTTYPDLQTAGHGGVGSINVNGARSNQNNLTLDGLGDVDSGNNGDQLATISLNSVQEFRVQTSNYQAQYGRSSGSQISVVTKSGTNQFHGSGYIFHRNEGLNANNWLDNREGLPRQLYRYNDAGFTFGGPVIIPHYAEKLKNKIYFFTSHEWQLQLQPEGLARVTVPTALERQGNFSQSVDKSGTPIPPIIDPTTHAPFPNGIIPANRLSQLGLNILNVFPLPNALSPENKGFNYQSQISASYPRREDDGRIDININDSNKIFTRFLYNYDQISNPYGSFVLGASSGNLLAPVTSVTDSRPGRSWVVGWTSNVSPTAVNEATWGFSKNVINIGADTAALSRAGTGLEGLPSLYPGAIQAGYIPRLTFDGTRLQNTTGYGSADAPFFNYNTTIEWIDNFTKVWGNHIVKIGFYAQRSRKDQTSFSDFNGSFDFGDDPSNPLDTGYGYANAALGNYRTFDQASQAAVGKYRYTNVEWYAQDTWKVVPKLSLDYGIRFYYIQPQYDAGLQTSTFLQGRFDPAAAPRLYYPAAGGGAIDRATGQTLPAYAVGDIVPNSGNLLNGIAQAGVNYSKYLMKNPGVTFGPRFGFAYDVTGHQNLVIRGGGGIFYDRYQGNEIFDEITNPPTTFQPALTYGNISGISGGGSNLLFGPSALHALDPSGQIPTTASYSLGIQTKLPWELVLDTAYVGSVSWHLLDQINFNAIPYETTFQPQNQDPTKVAATPNALLGSNAYSEPFVRPNQGYGDITYHGEGSSSNFNSLQVSLNREFAKGLFLGLAYTYSKALGVSSGDGDYLRIDNLTRFANYGPLNFDHRQTVAINYIYPFPDAFKGKNAVLHSLLDGWQVSGLTRLQTGGPYEASFSLPGYSNQNLTGSYTEPARIQVTGSPLSGTSNSPYNRLNPAFFAPPPVGNIGLGEGRYPFYGPGINDTDLSLQKTFALGERMNIALRLDAFNAFNHTQFSGINSNLNFAGTPNNYTVTNAYLNPNGTVNNINGFGTVSGARDPRKLQLSARFDF